MLHRFYPSKTGKRILKIPEPGDWVTRHFSELQGQVTIFAIVRYYKQLSYKVDFGHFRMPRKKGQSRGMLEFVDTGDSSLDQFSATKGQV